VINQILALFAADDRLLQTLPFYFGEALESTAPTPCCFALQTTSCGFLYFRIFNLLMVSREFYYFDLSFWTH